MTKTISLIAVAAIILAGFQCWGNFCLRSFDSEFTAAGDHQNFDFVDTETGEILLVRWLTANLTVNLNQKPDGEIECWTYNGEEMTDCNEQSF